MIRGMRILRVSRVIRAMRIITASFEGVHICSTPGYAIEVPTKRYAILVPLVTFVGFSYTL